MKLQILSVPDCPNVAPLQQRLAVVLADRADVTITTEVIETPEEAVRVGMDGSPTLLIDRIDPFAEPGQAPSMSCRLYRDETGHPSGAPSITQLHAALDVPGTPASRQMTRWPRPMGRATSGVQGIRFNTDDELLSLNVAGRPHSQRQHRPNSIAPSVSPARTSRNPRSAR